MAPLRAALVVLLASAVAALALAACGGQGDVLLPGDTADQIKENLDRVEQLVREGECFEAETATSEILKQVEDLQVDRRLQTALEKGINQLFSVVEECEEAEPETTESVETTEAEEPEETEKQKPEREKQPPEEAEGEEREEEPEGGEEEATPEPPTESEESSGGVGPGTAVEGE
ncbi:MAG: hypothetical protein R2725_11715 [Solirubrobacterales bacterium]